MKIGIAKKRPISVKFRVAEKEEEIKTLEGIMRADIGDYIITGVNGEIYPCKQDIFKKTYDVLEII